MTMYLQAYFQKKMCLRGNLSMELEIFVHQNKIPVNHLPEASLLYMVIYLMFLSLSTTTTAPPHYRKKTNPSALPNNIYKGTHR